jgi:hypothetical protein
MQGARARKRFRLAKREMEERENKKREIEKAKENSGKNEESDHEIGEDIDACSQISIN